MLLRENSRAKVCSMKVLAYGGKGSLILSSPKGRSQANRHDPWLSHAVEYAEMAIVNTNSGRFWLVFEALLKDMMYYHYPVQGFDTYAEADSADEIMYSQPWKPLPNPAPGEAWNYIFRPQVTAKVAPEDWLTWVQAN